jgi:hypothetical protein
VSYLEQALPVSLLLSALAHVVWNIGNLNGLEFGLCQSFILYGLLFVRVRKWVQLVITIVIGVFHILTIHVAHVDNLVLGFMLLLRLNTSLGVFFLSQVLQ